MRKLLSAITTCFLFLFCINFLPVSAAEEKVTLYKDMEEIFISSDSQWVYFDLIDLQGKKEEIFVCHYNGNDTEVTIPETIDGKTVVGIGDLYTDNYKGETVVKLFDDDLKVTSVILPKTIRIIEDYDYSEQWYPYPNDDESYFTQSSVADYIAINLKYMEVIPGISKDSITSFVVDKNNSYFKSIDGILYTKDGKKIVRYPAGKTTDTFKLPDSVKTIGTMAFTNTDINTVNGNKVTKLDSFAFYKSDIDKVNGLNNVSTLSKAAFLRSTIKSFPTLSKLTRIGNYAFAYCNNLSKLKFESALETVGNHAFYYCKNVKEIDFGKIKTIEGAGFAQCTSLTEALLPKTCSKLEGSAFSSCKKLVTVELRNVDKIGDKAFYKCSKLSSFGKDNKDNEITKAWKIGTDAFYKCTSLKKVSLPNLEELEGAFEDCTALKTIKMKNIPDEIYAGAFENTAYVNNHKDGIVYIGKLALCYKTPKSKPTYIKVKAGTTHIAAKCLKGFQGSMNHVKSIYIPSSVKVIQRENLSYFSNLKRVYIGGKVKFGKEVGMSVPKAKFYVKSNAKDAISYLKKKKLSYTTNWKPSKTKEMKAVGKTKTTAKVTWKKQGYVSGYKVYMKTSKNGKWKKVATLDGSNSTSYTKKGLKKNKTYYFRVRAYKTVEGTTYHGAYSSTDAAKTKKK